MTSLTSSGTPHRPEHPEALLFDEYFDRLSAVALQRIQIELKTHRLSELQRVEADLLELHREFGALLRVVFRYGLTEALREEARWYAAVLAGRRSPQDAFALLVDSWIVAIQGLIKPPECHALVGPLMAVREDLPTLISPRGPPRHVDQDTEALMARTIAGDLAGAQDIVRRRLAAGGPPCELVPDLLLAAMAEIGARWEQNALDIFQEHLATETVLRLLASLPTMVPAAPKLGRKALVSGAPEDHIQMVPTALAVYLELRGWQALSLGHGLPAGQIAAAVEALQPDAVFLSLAMVARLEGALDTVERLARMPRKVPVVAGGRGARLARTWLEAAGASVAESFDQAHRVAMGKGDVHA